MAANHRFPFKYLEDRPVHPGAPLHVGSMNDRTQCNESPDLLLSNLSQMPKQRFANPELPECFPHIEVLELHTWSNRARSGISRGNRNININSWLARPRREVEEVESKTDWLM